MKGIHFLVITTLATIAVCVGLFVSPGWAKDLTTNWSPGITVDGQTHDWDNLEANQYKDKNAWLTLAADSSALYLLFRTDNPQYARRIILSGVKFSLTPKTKGATTSTLTFRAGPPLEEIRKRPGGGLYRPIPTNIQHRRDSIDALGGQLTWSVETRDKDTSIDIPIDGSQGPKAAFGPDTTQYTYELSLPLKDYPGSPYKVAAGPGQKIDVRIAWNTFDRPRMKHRPGRDTTNGGYFPGDRDGDNDGADSDMGGFPGSRSVRLPGEASDDSPPQEIKFTTTLPTSNHADQGSRK